MNEYSTIELLGAGGRGTILLNRPLIHNAFNEKMITEIREGLQQLVVDERVRIILIRGRGKSFCAGADLQWMSEAVNYSEQQNFDEGWGLSECLYALYTCPKPTLAVVHGSAFGGANGLLAACDMAVCTDDAVFSLSELKLGLIPAIIAPFVIKRVGENVARELMLTGKRIHGTEAETCHLVNRSLPAGDLEQYIDDLAEQIMTSGPTAIRECKRLIHEVVNSWSLDEARKETARWIAKIRVSDEGQEGMAAFLAKRKPRWLHDNS